MTSPSKWTDIAIIGVGVRLPGADSLDEFWRHLAAARSLISEVPARRWDKTALRGNPAKGNKTSSIRGGFIDQADCFDARFFNISPREAAWMDPQQRFALELAWQAIEDAGYRASALAGSNTGVFMGVCHWDYAELLEKHLAQIDAYLPTGIAFSIIANRVSHFFDLRGPSIANDTACAASLTSVHEAVRALQSGNCELALAGGVNLIWSPNHFIAFSKNGMLSREGASMAFDERADGYVRGEGGAMLLLKPLNRALADGDAIHGVIRGSGVNHGGRTNSLTVTNPQAQAELISRVIRVAEVAPESITYIEAHGTGTPLGDPIEIAGLKQAFASLYEAAGETPVAGSCGIGSVKTNIGHLEGAAGVAGIVKVLAALGHEALPANVDFGQINALINLDSTPFRIQHQLTAWPRTPGQPRRAGVSAFGFGGSNAHVLLEEAPLRPESAAVIDIVPELIPLSARDEGRLVAIAGKLLDYLAGPGHQVALADLAWTLQQGREAMAVRVVWRVADLATLKLALADFIKVGTASSFIFGLESGQESSDPMLELATQWLAGEAVDWSRLAPDATRRRIHLPTYPFARERYWMDAALGAKDPEAVIHPLLHRNLSRIGRQCYQTPLAGSEFFWAEHHVGTVQVLPGVVCLEMARAAWAQAAGLTEDAAVSCRINQVVWTRPVVAGESPARVEIRLQPARHPASADSPGKSDTPLLPRHAELDFEIERLEADATSGNQNAQGSIVQGEVDIGEVLDLAALRAAASTAAVTAMTPELLYQRLAATGMHHGPSFRAITGCHRGPDFFLVSLKLPRLLRATLDSFALHPVMLDAAIQAWIGLENVGDGLPGAAVPFSCRQVDVRGGCSESMWALLKPIGGRDAGLRRFDITLADREGRVKLRFHELALRVMAPPVVLPAPLFSMPHWELRPLSGESGQAPARQTQVLLAGFAPSLVAQLCDACTLDVDVLPEPADAGDCILAWFDLLRQRLLSSRGGRKRQQWLVMLPEGQHDLSGSALAALLRCMVAEQPTFAGAVLRVAPELTPTQLVSILQAEAAREDGFTEIRYDAAGQRSVSRHALIELPDAPVRLPDAEGLAGVVLITGGRGGLGRHFVDWLTARGVRQIVVSGRAPDAAEADGGKNRAQVIYRSCDVTKADEVQALVGWIEAELGPLKGIIHAAGVLRDGYLINKQPEDVAAVFAPKVRGVLNLDQATRDLPLDFFVLCSSIAATLGNPGQSDYAAANAFMDAFAEARSRQVAGGERQGLTLALAWPLWAEGGMTVDDASLKALQRRFGSQPLPTAVALAALDAVLAAGRYPRVTLHYGKRERILQLLSEFGAESSLAVVPHAVSAQIAGAASLISTAPESPSASLADTLNRTVDWLKDLLGELIQMDPAKIRANRRLEEYGLDSIVIVEMTNRMEESLGPLSKTLFFEYVDLAGVAGHLVEEQGAALAAFFAKEHAADGAGDGDAVAAGAAAEPPVADEVTRTNVADAENPGRHDIAIVGLSLHVAGADDQESFWQMLEQGHHGFRRIPPERWNHETLVYPERDVLGKTVVQTGAFLDGIDLFDPRYFRISPAEAELMSPEVRLFLQTCVEAFEDAGYSRETLQRQYDGEVAVIVGSMTNDYNLYGFQNMLQRGSLASGSYTGTVPNMVSYYYGFTGPSYFLDTMCSAAATCVHEAVHMLRSGRTRMALAGGISLLLHPQKLIATSQEHFTSKTAEVIRGYGQGADGTILGEGVGALVMKRLVDAERDGDHIYGVIKGTGISNAGVRNGFTVPNPRQQSAAIEQALKDSGIPPESIGYIEGHGSGTALGDPIEIKALTEVYGKYIRARQVCPIGTVKSNVAHLLGAAALPGIVKVLLQMQHGKLAPSLHAETLNPHIPFAETPFHVQRELAEWSPGRDQAGRQWPRRAGVTSIGAGGVNVHILIEEYPTAPVTPDQAGDVLCVFSAMNTERLRALLERFCIWLDARPNASMADVAWTLQAGRNELPCRLAVVVRDQAQLRQALAQFLAHGKGDNGLFFTASILDRDPRIEPAQVAAALAQNELGRLGAWWADGVSIAWENLSRSGIRRRLSLPSYPFEQVRCWYQSSPDAPSVVAPLGASLKLHPFVGRNQSDRYGLRYQTSIYLGELLDYVFTLNRQQQVLPTVLPEIFAALARLAGFGPDFELRDLEVGRSPNWPQMKELSAAVLTEADQPVIELADSTDEALRLPFARVRLGGKPQAMAGFDLDDLRTGAGPALSASQLYPQLAHMQLSFLPYLEVIDALWLLGGGGSLADLRHAPQQQDHFKRNVVLSAQALAAAWQMLVLARPACARFSLGRIARIYLGIGEARQVLLRPVAGKPEDWDVFFLTATGQTSAALLGLQLSPPEQLAWSKPGAAMPAAVSAALSATMSAATSMPPVRLMQVSAVEFTAPNDGANVNVAGEGAAGDDGVHAAYAQGLRELVAQLLKFPLADINPRSPFYELGFDSISLTRLANEINIRYGSTLTPALFYECEHIDALAGWLAARLPAAVVPQIVAEKPVAFEVSSRLLQSPAPAASPADAVAIVGMSVRLPGSSTAEAFFAHLLQGDDLVGALPLERYSPAYRARMEAGGFPLQGGFLADIDRFDAAFFKTTPHEASRMDPQQRLVLETAQQAVESAGYRADELPGATGVFVGVSGRDYASLLQAYGVDSDAYVATGNSLAMVANRVSWQFNLHGPSEAVDTACSSSLVALLRAVESIRTGQCAMALAGGVNLALSIEGFAGPWQAGMLSPSGRCRTFAADADGYVRGEGVVVLVLKGLAAAERDGDSILGLVAGGAINHGGHAGSLTAPNAKAQAELVTRAMAGIAPQSIAYIETHGTGTPLGDPVEVNGLRLAYARLAENSTSLRIGLGSVKANIGHLEAAAGLAGVVKVLMAMRARELPPTLHCSSVNPYIELQDSPFYLTRSRQPWPLQVDAQGRRLPRRAGVSSFGFGGSNAHVVLEAYEGNVASSRRSPLPPRVFAETRYWLPAGREIEFSAAMVTEAETVLLTPHWQVQTLPLAGGAVSRRRLILPCEFDLGALATRVPELIVVPPQSAAADERYQNLADILMRALQQAVKTGLDGELLVQLLVPRDAERGMHAGLGALLDSVGEEIPHLLGQVIEVPPTISAAEALACLDREAQSGKHRRIRYQDGRRLVRVWQTLPATSAVKRSFSWRPGGVYLISGGLGALGRLLVGEITRQAAGVTLLLVGASPLDPDRQQALADLAQSGATLRYQQMDISDGPAVTALVRQCVAQHGALHGVIHCAGIHRDSALIRKTSEQLRAVCAPKVGGAWALREACRGLALDCFVMFSSLAGAVGNAGQADYAAANGFLDALAEWHKGPMLAIDWPLWRAGGMRVSPAGEHAFFERMGQRPLGSAQGLNALQRCLDAGQNQLAVVAGDADRIQAFFHQAAFLPGTASATTKQEETEVTDAALRRGVVQHLGALLAEISGLAAAQILADEALEQYGIDSLMINRLNQALGERFGRLSKTLFFECRTLAQVADHLLAKHADACCTWVGQTGSAALASPVIRREDVSLSAGQAGTGEEPIAVIGISGRYPGAADLAQFWANLSAGREMIGEIPAERWSLDGFYEADPDRAVASGMSYSRWGGFVEGFADFDPLFFRISPREAAAMDPQERLFLMQAWAACEDAGYTRARLAAQHDAQVGVFVGVTKTGFEHYGVWQGDNGALVRPVTSFASVANRVSFCLGLRGPSLPIDTMCSSSLTAIHEACEQLRRGECALALVGGVNLYLHPDNYIELSAARMLSPDGHCRSFGAGGKGFVPGEGVGCVVLKPLSRALADGDQVHGLILGSAVNHGGNTAGYTVPNPLAQGAVIQAALARAGVAGADISYVEAHGTGTELGDPIEFSGLCQAFGEGVPAGACALGSVKSGIGHLEAAAGIAGLTKVLLQMRYRQLAPTLHVEAVNPNLDLAGTPFHLQTRTAPWRAPTGQNRLLAGVSSFGAGGANAHVVVEAWPVPADDNAESAPEVQAILLSARDPERLRESVVRLLAFLAGDDAVAVVADPPSSIQMLSRMLAEILSVEAADIDPAESLDSYGVEAVHRHALRRRLEQDFDLSLTTPEVSGWDSISDIAHALAGRLPSYSVNTATDNRGPNLADLAWTLQIGREAMQQRLAILAASREELRNHLNAWLQAAPGEELPNVLSGSADGRRGALGLLADEPDVQGMLARWFERGELPRVLGLWVQGLEVDWRLLPRRRPPRIVSAPTYPFARERYWRPRAPENHDVSGAVIQALAMDAAGRDKLLAEHKELEIQLARLVSALIADWPVVPSSVRWQSWQMALLALQQSALAGRQVPAATLPAAAWADWHGYRCRVEAGGGPLAQITLVETVLRALPEILAERRPATAVMFPEGRMDLVEAVYKQNAVAARFNDFLSAAAAAFVRVRAAVPGTRLRILEIGAGTGGTTAPLLKALAPWSAAIAEYRYTDVSRAFLIHAERHFQAQAPWLATALFDVEKPLAEQGVTPGSYDLVIAANVLHATRQMDQTLSTVRELLAPGGVLLVNETSCATLFTHLTFGLLDGWWRFVDPQRRIPGAPALALESWQRLVTEVGLDWIGATAICEHALGQQVWAARRSLAGKNAAIPRPWPQSTQRIEAVSLAKTSAGQGTRSLIVEALAATLNIAPTAIDVTFSFADYGLDSILGAELVHRLNQHSGARLAQTDLFDYPSVRQLAAYLDANGGFTQAVPVEVDIIPDPHPHADFQVTRSLADSFHQHDRATAREPIAIVGYSGRFAGSENPEALWQHLLAGDDLVQPVTRFDLAPFYRDAAPGAWCNHGSFIDDIDRFDARFFNISGLEATYMDPQQRLFLQEAWRTLEHAGHAGADIEGQRCGVFVGCAHGDYQELFQGQPPGQAFWGNTCSLIPARIAYYLDLKGPAVAVDTACSSSLVALHLACHSLWAGESELALAGGVFIQSSPRFYLYANQANMLSPSGRCAAFGAGADGIVPGEAVAAVLLRPLSQALANGDTIHGLIVASGINQDGATNGITAPSALSQEQLIREVYQRHGIDPTRIGLVEGHGTGTPLGDPIEHTALTRAYRGWTDATAYCALGSIKSNLGHATTAAGIAGLLKILLALEHQQIPPTLHAVNPNPGLSMADSPFYLNSRPVAWPAQPERPRQAAISSFGFGGTNAHLVIEEGPSATPSGLSRPAWLFVLSARSADLLKTQAANLAEHLCNLPRQAAADIAYTLSLGRRHAPHRLFLVAADQEELEMRIVAWLAGEHASEVGTAVVEDMQGRATDVASSEHLSSRLAQTNDIARYRRALIELGQAYLAGQDKVPALQFGDGQGRRVPLPTTVFAGKSYWVPRVHGVNAVTALPDPATSAAASIPPARAVMLATVSADRITHRLAAPASYVNFATKLGSYDAPKVQLTPLTPSLRSPTAIASTMATTTPLQRLPDADGVRSLRILGPWDDRLLTDLARELALAAGDGQINVVCLVGDWHAPADCIGSLAAPGACPLNCDLPVIAALPSAQGAAMALAAYCDFVVLAETGRYAAAPTLPAAVVALLQRRFGVIATRRLMAADAAELGKNLATGVVVVAADDVYARALELARRVSDAPRQTLVELKRHMRSGVQAPKDLPAPALGVAELSGALASDAAPAAWGKGRRLQLASTVMELELFDDGVALLRMQERQHKNTFTPAFMAGMEEAFALLSHLPACKVLVLSGHDRYFACGGTREGLESLQRGDSHFTDQRIYTLPFDFPLPVIAAMQGHAIGAGWSLGMFCDLSLFSADSVYHSNYLRFGFTPGAGATLIFPHRLGDDLGREVLFTAREYKGGELACRGIPLSVFPSAEVVPRALAAAHRLATQSREQLLAAKAAATAGLRSQIEGVLAKELAMHEKTFIGNPLVKARIARCFANAVPTTTAVPPAPTSVELRGNLRRQMVDSLAEELMIAPEEISDGDGFLALGLDSILAVTWIRKLNAQLGIDLPATCVYAQPTVRALLDEVVRLVAVAQPQPVDVPPIVASVRPAPTLIEWRGRLRRQMVDSLAEELMIAPEEISDGDGFLALGLDSILAVTWIRKLNARLDIALPATCVYAQPTVAALLDEVVRLAPATPGETHPLPESVQVEPVVTVVRAAFDAAPSSVRIAPGAGPEDAIAIIGAAGRFPMSADLDAFWANIRNGQDCVEEVPPSRWDSGAYYDPDPQASGKSYSKWMGAIGDIDLFDASFFNITAREAELMDPQQRIFLQHAWQAIEDGAIDPASLAGQRCGVFVGSGDSGYGDLVGETNAYSLIGSAGSILAARIAYLLDLRGPCIALDTACSTSLVAIASACDSLVLGNSDLALAGGVCVLLGPKMHIDTCKVGMLSPDGHCYSFDQRANGFVPGEGVGVVLLKRLADAQRDGDPIRAVIRGWGVNQDGHTNGITAPNPLAQGELLRDVYRRFAIPAASIGLVEAHGTGTPLGDPIEIEGLRAGFAPLDETVKVALGSVKSNVGHLLAAAGVAGVLKAMLALEHAELPPSINFRQHNEHLALAGSPFQIQTRLAPWSIPAGRARRAAVSAFGFSGTNAHLVLEEYRPSNPAQAPVYADAETLLCVLSARSRNQLAAQAALLSAHLEASLTLNLADVCWTLQTGRRAFECRAALVFTRRDELLARLRTLAAGESAPGMLLGGIDAGAQVLFENDDDARELLDKWLLAGRLEHLAKLWVQGATVDWRRLPGVALRRRLHLPGCAFARERHWVKAKVASPVRQSEHSLIDCGEIGGRRFAARIRGDEAWLSHQLTAGGRLLTGLFYPEMVRAAGELASARQVVGLRHVVWGRPLRIEANPRELALHFESATDRWLYRIGVAGAEEQTVQVGELLLAGETAVAWPSPPEVETAVGAVEDCTAAFRQSHPGARGIRSVLRGAEVWRARWSRPPLDSLLAFDPLLLDAVWQLLNFRDQALGLPGLRFPLALESLRRDGALPEEGWIWLWSRSATASGLTVLVLDVAGRPCLWLEGFVSECLDALAALQFEPEEKS